MSNTFPGDLELLAPAGDLDSLKAALDHGADAVYLGAAAFSARSQAKNFPGEELRRAIELAHLHGAYAYLALNTLILDTELEQALDLARQAYVAGVDAVIVQDTGLARLLRKRLPGLPLHASTQLTITDAAGLELAARLGFCRVILARELILPEIATLTARASQLGLETEVFIHGAICLGLSGQCLLSSLAGGRSGNRGDCAQSCRLPWQIPAHNEAESTWLSPCDQALPQALASLQKAGVRTLKIEGRQKNAAYTGQVTAVYRQILDRLAQNQPLAGAETDRLQERLALAFNRGGRFSSRVVDGQMGQDFLSGSYSGSHGIYLGQVAELAARSGRLWLKPHKKDLNFFPERGDILSLREQDREVASAPLGIVKKDLDLILVQGFHPDVLARVQKGTAVYQMSSAAAAREAKKARPARTSLELELELTTGFVKLRARVQKGPLAGLLLVESLALMPVPPLKAGRVQEQLAKTGGSSFVVEKIDGLADLPLTIAALNGLRRSLLEKMAEKIRQAARRQLPGSGQEKSSQSEKTTRPDQMRGQALAFFYQLPPKAEQLPCGAGNYVLPLFDQPAARLKAYLAAILAQEPAARIYAWIPAARYGRLALMLPVYLSRLAGWGFTGLVLNQSGPDLAAILPEKEKESARALSWGLDSSGNVFNGWALAGWQEEGPDFIVPSLELSDQDLLRLAGDTSGPARLVAPVYGRARVMSSAFCSIGFNEPGCRKCLADGSFCRYELKNRRGQAYTILTYPMICQMELLHHENKMELSRVRRLDQADKACWLGGFYFLDESQEKRSLLLREFFEGRVDAD